MQALKRLPGLGYRSAEKVALHLLVKTRRLAQIWLTASRMPPRTWVCETCGNLAEGPLCSLCLSEERDEGQVCVVEGVTDLFAMERAGVFRGVYHVLHGKLAPVRGWVRITSTLPP